MKSKKLDYVANNKGRKENRRKGILDMSENTKKALQAQLQEIKEYGTLNTGYYWNVFKKIDLQWAFNLLEENIQNGLIDKNIKNNTLMDIALQLYIDDINEDDENDLIDFSNFNDEFMNYSTYTVEFEELEKNN